jgi:DNA-binding response OmpR family regulator/aminoglycoside phosphotransferase
MSGGDNIQARILVVQADARYGEWLRHHLGVLCPDSSVTLLALDDFEGGIETVSGRDFEVLMLGAPFGSSPEDPDARGLELLRKLRERPKFPAIIAIADEGNELTAVRALRLGATDYVPKRLLTADRLKNSIRLVLRRIEKKRSARQLAKRAQLNAKRETARQTPSVPSPAAEADAKNPAADAKHPAVESYATRPGGEFMPSDFFPGYTLHATVGESEKAAVYLATSARLGHNVALKVSKTLRDETAGRQFLEREFTAIAAIRHPSVVQIHDYGVHAGYEYLAMEYLPEGDLKSRMQQGLTERQALRYVEQIAAALQVVHAAGLVHRDLKPPNIMLRDNGDVALIDFGLARSVDGGTQLTQTGVLRGSPYYMSPEQALGDPLDPRSDFYSLGIMFYEMLTSRKPYTGSSAMDVLQLHVNAPLPRLPPSLAHYEPLLAKLLAKSRDERFADAAEIIAAVESAHDLGRKRSSAA